MSVLNVLVPVHRSQYTLEAQIYQLLYHSSSIVCFILFYIPLLLLLM